MDYKHVIQKNLNFYLEKKNKKQRNLVDDLNFSSGMVSNWCSGARTPTINNLTILADYFDINIINFFLVNNDINQLIKAIDELDPEYKKVVQKELIKQLIDSK